MGTILLRCLERGLPSDAGLMPVLISFTMLLPGTVKVKCFLLSAIYLILGFALFLLCFLSAGLYVLSSCKQMAVLVGVHEVLHYKGLVKRANKRNSTTV